VEANIVSKQGAFFSYGGTRLGQGRENAKEYLRENPEMAQEIEAEIRRKLDAASPALALVPEAPPEGE